MISLHDRVVLIRLPGKVNIEPETIRLPDSYIIAFERNN